VKQAVHKPSGVRVAIKIYEKFKLMDPAKKTSVKREIHILKKLDHSNIVKLFEVIDTPKQVFIILKNLVVAYYGICQRCVFIIFPKIQTGKKNTRIRL
jgi:serine/threonine protein kinase